MAQYIDKSAVVAELNRLIAELVEEGEDTMFEQGRISAFEDLKVFINHTIEAKEVDFIKEFYAFSEKHKLMDKDIEFSDIEKTASFFFQLGLKAQKGK